MPMARETDARDATRPDPREIASELCKQMDDAWNAHDAAAMAALFEPQGVFVLHTGLALRGAEKIAAFWTRRVFPETPAGYRHLSAAERARVVAKDVIIAEGTLVIHDVMAADEDSRVRVETKVLGVLVRRDDVWRISLVQLWVPQPM
jgi:uncharacterized protein (TIGR02246 family)